jgi:hypothetical protein
MPYIGYPNLDRLSQSSGLDLRRTTPPIAQIVDLLIGIAGNNPLLCAIQISETLDPASSAELTPRFSWAQQQMYGLDAPGQNHGLILGTRGWVPQTSN